MMATNATDPPTMPAIAPDERPSSATGSAGAPGDGDVVETGDVPKDGNKLETLDDVVDDGDKVETVEDVVDDGDEVETTEDVAGDGLGDCDGSTEVLAKHVSCKMYP